jgi:hypothetical protein
VASDSTQFLFGNYTTPNRTFNPPSDLESEFEVDNSVNSDSNSISPQTNNTEIKRLNKLVDIYKNKFSQLKEAYKESESENERIKVN